MSREETDNGGRIPRSVAEFVEVLQDMDPGDSLGIADLILSELFVQRSGVELLHATCEQLRASLARIEKRLGDS